MTSRTQRMPARPSDPWISVYAVGQFAFCSRAGLIAAWDKSDDDAEEVETPPNLAVRSFRRFQVPYSLGRIERMLARITATIALSGLTAMGATCTVVYFAFRSDGNLQSTDGFFALLISVIVLLGASYIALKQWRPWRQMKTLRAFALNAKPTEPDPSSQETQQVNWWSLIRAGFVSRPSREKISFESWKLAGSPPFRILQKGDVRIPVFRLKDGSHLFAKHFVRAAAYCKLLESTGANSPYALALFRDTYDCVALPNSPGSRKTFHETLLKARAVVQQGSADSPSTKGVCSGCIHGRPQEGETFYIAGEPIEPYYATSTKGTKFHSRCGDLFQWVPEHKQAQGLELYVEDDGEWEYEEEWADDE